MSEYPNRDCGDCPHLGAFQASENNKYRPDTSYLRENTVPKPRVTFQDFSDTNQNHLGVGSTTLKPNLSVFSPTEQSQISEVSREVVQKSEQSEKRYKGGIPPCSHPQKQLECEQEHKQPNISGNKQEFCKKEDPLDCDCHNIAGKYYLFQYLFSSRSSICSENSEELCQSYTRN